ncbi:zinc finger CCHC-type and RNA-binding motif-containing protein 1-like [Cimex lectularius]|uniref:Uncharacterized protein n=1 Tax=Cimex lectularius TaxID=79782 RepID=A0A8I6TIV6_CIMLE|nr:zinc finger CCHC-type and RNA-binding motif-containing protein 1-like [Cimex lectularius]
MNSSLAPSKTTVYVSNLAFSLTNNDLHKIFSKFGQVIKVTIVKDQYRRSKGVAFIQYLDRESAIQCSKSMDGTEMHSRRIKCSMARDNGRSSEFIKKKFYPDKSTCYECGEEGHLSYQCPKNSLGSRTPPKKKERKKRKKRQEENEYDEERQTDEEGEEPDMETLSAVIRLEQAKFESENKSDFVKKKRIKKNSYFSDEEELSD